MVDYPDSVHNAQALTLIAKVEEEEVGMKESVMERRQVWTRRASTSPAELGLLKGTIVGRVVVPRWHVFKPYHSGPGLNPAQNFVSHSLHQGIGRPGRGGGEKVVVKPLIITANYP